MQDQHPALPAAVVGSQVDDLADGRDKVEEIAANRVVPDEGSG